jgi:hypothetical protein
MKIEDISSSKIVAMINADNNKKRNCTLTIYRKDRSMWGVNRSIINTEISINRSFKLKIKLSDYQSLSLVFKFNYGKIQFISLYFLESKSPFTNVVFIKDLIKGKDQILESLLAKIDLETKRHSKRTYASRIRENIKNEQNIKSINI